VLEKFLDQILTQNGLAFFVLAVVAYLMWRENTRERAKLWEIIERREKELEAERERIGTRRNGNS
jgi:preprotein translocase subunit SecG